MLSAGALPYPITFLATDLLSELYGRRRANRVVWAGFAASLFALLALWLGAQFPALSDSPVGDETYNAAFANTWRVIAASMTAYLFAQFVDVRLFHFWKGLTNGRHLWLRNNASTVVSRRTVVETLFGASAPRTVRTLDNVVLHLRKMFEKDPGDPRHLHTVRGVGFRFEP